MYLESIGPGRLGDFGLGVPYGLPQLGERVP
jgi:hypothetical protein